MSETGRAKTTTPAIQSMPLRTETGKALRDAFARQTCPDIPTIEDLEAVVAMLATATGAPDTFIVAMYPLALLRRFRKVRPVLRRRTLP